MKGESLADYLQRFMGMPQVPKVAVAKKAFERAKRKRK